MKTNERRPQLSNFAMEMDSYYESSYPRMANDEDDLPTTNIADEVQCAVCTLVLLDPMTLCCGHSFCHLCLARLWHSKSRVSISTLLCPTCREPWVQMPQINIQLRNIVESVYRESVNKRRQALTSEDQTVLSSFSKTRGNRSSQDMAPLLRVMFLLFLALGVGVVVIGVLVGWVWTGANGEFMRKPVRVWKSEDVLAWVEGLGEWTAPNITRLFQIQALTGPQLLLVENQTLADFGIEQQFRRQTILQAIELLRTEEYSQPLDFYQFKAAHRKTTLLLALFFPSWPRLTLIYSYLFEHYTVYLPLGRAQFSNPLPEDELSWLQSSVLLGLILLFPHVGVCVLCVEWAYTHPFICVPVVVHCTVTMTQEVLALFKTGIFPIRSKLLSFGGELIKFIVCGGLYHLVWPLVPHFICDAFLYLTLWNTFVAYLIVKPLKRLFT